MCICNLSLPHTSRDKEAVNDEAFYLIVVPAFDMGHVSPLTKKKLECFDLTLVLKLLENNKNDSDQTESCENDEKLAQCLN